MVNDLCVVCAPSEKEIMQRMFEDALVIVPGTMPCGEAYRNLAVTTKAREHFPRGAEKMRFWWDDLATRRTAL